jgi:hypothetical protein
MGFFYYLNKEEAVVKKCSRYLVVMFFVVAMLLTRVASSSEAYTLDGLLQGGAMPLRNATITLADAVTFSVIETTNSDANGAYLFNVDEGTYHLFITPPVGSEYRGTIISNVMVNGKDVSKNVVLVTKNSPNFDRILISDSSQIQIEKLTSKIAGTSENVASRANPIAKFLFSLPDCSDGMCE